MNNTTSNSFLCDNYVEDFPQNAKYFTEFIVDDFIDISKFNDDVKSVLSIKSNVSIQETHLCKDIIDIKYDDHIIQGMLLRTTLKLSFQIKYIGGTDGRSVYVKTTKFLKTMYISIPTTIGDCSILNLYRKNKISSHAYVEDIQTSGISNQKIHFSLAGLININFILPNY